MTDRKIIDDAHTITHKRDNVMKNVVLKAGTEQDFFSKRQNLGTTSGHGPATA
jgi:hypothetical protein